MNENEDTVVVFTARSPERIVEEGGSQAWILNAARAKLCKWLVCTQNRHNPDHEFSDATEPHGCGFLLGKIAEIRESAEEGGEQRWMVAISEFARISRPNLWDHGRNPVRYASLESLGINPGEVRFEAVPSSNGRPTGRNEKRSAASPVLTIAEAKKALAASFGGKPEAVEITIRG